MCHRRERKVQEVVEAPKALATLLDTLPNQRGGGMRMSLKLGVAHDTADTGIRRAMASFLAKKLAIHDAGWEAGKPMANQSRVLGFVRRKQDFGRVPRARDISQSANTQVYKDQSNCGICDPPVTHGAIIATGVPSMAA